MTAQPLTTTPGAPTTAGSVRVGDRVLRREDARLVTGETRWTSNLTPADAVHAVVVRSPLGHARLTRIDTSAAAAAEGVVAVFTSADLPEGHRTEPVLYPTDPHPARALLATDVVRFAGEPVAVVLAESEAAAWDAAELVDVDYEPLPVVSDGLSAVAEGAPLVHEALGTNVVTELSKSRGDDVDAALEEARRDGVVLQRRFTLARVMSGAMEPRSVLAAPDPDVEGGFVLHTSTQTPHLVKHLLTVSTGIPAERIRVIAPDVGGGFGGKLGSYAEEHLCLLMAQQLGRPVAWMATRSEDSATTVHGRVLVQDVTLAATKDGRITALDVDILGEAGAYLSAIGPGSALGAWAMYPGIYLVPAYRFHGRAVLTNGAPVGAYRGAGRPEATFAIERIVDELATELGLDPVEVRRRNWATEFPFTNGAGLTYDIGDYAAATDKALTAAGYDELREEQRKRREAGDPVQLGIGLSTYVEVCGGGIKPSPDARETAEVRLTREGGAEVVTGTSPFGTGHETSWAQIVSDVLGVPFEDVKVVHGDTALAPHGFDSYGSRSLIVGGAAVHAAAVEVRDKARELAARLLECDPGDVELVTDGGGRFQVRGTSAGVSLAQVAEASYAADAPADVEPGLGCLRDSNLRTQTFPHGTHIAVAEVDTETGHVRLRSYIGVDDVGTVVNPVVVEGQQHGGIAQGIAQALYEEASYDEDGNLLGVALADYGMPAAPDLPPFVVDRTATPATSNELGSKGAGETGAIGAPPAVVNAVLDAVRHLGVRELQVPMTPQRVWRALQEARG